MSGCRVDQEKFLSRNSIHELFGDLKDFESISIFERSGFLFLNELDHRLDLLESAIQKNQFDQIKYQAHRLKGDFNAMGAPYLVEICRAIEANLKISLENNSESSRELFYEKFYLLKNCSYLFRDEFLAYLKQLETKLTDKKTETQL